MNKNRECFIVLRSLLAELNTVWSELDDEKIRKAGTEHGILVGKQQGIDIATSLIIKMLRELRENGK